MVEGIGSMIWVEEEQGEEARERQREGGGREEGERGRERKGDGERACKRDLSRGTRATGVIEAHQPNGVDRSPVSERECVRAREDTSCQGTAHSHTHIGTNTNPSASGHTETLYLSPSHTRTHPLSPPLSHTYIYTHSSEPCAQNKDTAGLGARRRGLRCRDNVRICES